jgi:tRNA (guanine-N7-)-methyltransferase
MARKKLSRINAAKQLPNVYAQEDIAQAISLLNYKNVVLELGCGDGWFAVEYAALHPEILVIGVDVKLDRLYKGASLALSKGLENCIFTRVPIENLQKFLPQAVCDKIFLTFPDPQPKKSNAKKRLTNIKLLKIYQKVSKPAACVYLKTDSDLLYEYTLEQLQELGVRVKLDLQDIHSELTLGDDLLILTRFEEKFLDQNLKIKALGW